VTGAELSVIRQVWAKTCADDVALLMKAAQDQVAYDEIQIPLSGGATSRALVFRPKEAPFDGSPLIVTVHGGGFIFGVADMEAATCINATRALGCVSISIEHRLSPEAKFPVAFEDCWDALQWVSLSILTSVYVSSYFTNLLLPRSDCSKCVQI
jgi:acetyl esterase/lipase